MGSNPSKRRNFNTLDEPNSGSDASSRCSTLVRRKKRRMRRNGDAASVTSLESRTSSLDVSYEPNGRFSDDRAGKRDTSGLEMRRSAKCSMKQNGDSESVASLGENVTVELRRITPIADGSRPGDDGSPYELDCNDNKVKAAGCPADGASGGREPDAARRPPEVTSHPDSGADYNGGGALPKRGSVQDALSRLVRNGLGTNRKSSLRPYFDCSRDECRRKLSQLCDVDFLPSGHVAVSTSAAGKSGLRVYPLSELGRSGWVLGDALLAAPRGICSNGDDSIAVTDWTARTVRFVTLEGVLLDSWKTNKFQHPGGIAINRDGRYVVADIARGQAAMGLYTPYGKLLRRFGSEHFEWPWYVAVDQKNRIIVSERKSGSISVFDDVGSFLFRFGGSPAAAPDSGGRSTQPEEQLNCPGGVAVDGRNNVIVADTENYRVALFSPDGAFIKTMLTTRSRPVSVAYDDGHLAVATDSDLRVYQTYAEKTAF